MISYRTCRIIVESVSTWFGNSARLIAPFAQFSVSLIIITRGFYSTRVPGYSTWPWYSAAVLRCLSRVPNNQKTYSNFIAGLIFSST